LYTAVPTPICPRPFLTLLELYEPLRELVITTPEIAKQTLYLITLNNKAVFMAVSMAVFIGWCLT
jgi:hypothetical protein